MNHSGISGQETMVLFKNAIGMNKDMQLRLILDLHSPENVELPLTLGLLIETQKQLSTMV